MDVMENIRPGKRLGLRPPKRAARLELHRFLNPELGAIPPHPAAADHLGLVRTWGLYGNDRYGDCGPVSVANYIRLVSTYLTGVEVDVPLDAVFDLYRRSGNPDFNPDTGAGDNGVDMQTMLEAMYHGGIAGIKPVAFAAVNPTDPEVLRAAISIFGAVLFGSVLDTAQETQFESGHAWDYLEGSPLWGGHATLVGQYTPPNGFSDFSLVTWGQVQHATDRFVIRQNQEAWVVIMKDHFGTRAFQEGIDVNALAEDYKALTGHSLPFRPSPDPTPAPDPDPDLAADMDLVAATRAFCLKHHGREGEVVRRAILTWKSKRGYGDA